MRPVGGGLDEVGPEVWVGAVQSSLWSAARVWATVRDKLTTRANVVALDIIASWGLLVVDGDWRCCLGGGIGVSAAVVLLRYGLRRGVSVDV